MVNYRIGYHDAAASARTIDLLPGDDGVRIEWRTEINRNVSSTGKYENVVQNTLRFITFEAYFKEAAFHKLETFMSFAQQGQPFSFTKNPAKGSETLNGAVSTGDNSLIASATVTGFEVGDFIILRDTEGLTWDVCEVEAIADTTITLVDPITHDYDDGTSIFWYYDFPALYLIDEKFDPDRDGDYWNHTFNCVEVR